MKRRFLIPGLAAFITLAILFIGCAQPTDTTVTTGGAGTPLVKLSDPVVRVTPYEGFNVISWEPVPDAASYSVWRTDTESSSQVKITAFSDTNLSAIDNIAATSTVAKLANGRTYKYIVVATPHTSRYASSTAITKAQEDLYSGKGEAIVTANIPDPATYKVRQASGITYRLDPDGMLYVSWTQPANAKAKIGYFPGGYPADAVLTSDAFDKAFKDFGAALFTDTEAGYLYPRNAVSATFPFIGGKATIAIQTEYWNGTTAIYAKDIPATVDIVEYDQYDLDLQWTNISGSTPPAPALTATYIYKTATTGEVQLTWPRIEGDEDVYSGEPYNTDDSKVTYHVYKRETALNDEGIYLGQGANGWNPVEVTIANTSDIQRNNIIYAKEKAVGPFLGTWQYIVFASASNGGKTSYSYPLSKDLTRTLPAEATINSAIVVYGGDVNDTTNTYTNRISVGGLTEGVSYTLYRGELTPILSKSNASGTARWVKPDDLEYEFTGYDTTVDTWPGRLVLGETTAVIYDTNIAARKIYIYKLVSSIGDTLLGDGSIMPIADQYHDSTNDFATVYSALNFGVQALDSSKYGTGGDVYSTTSTVKSQGYITATLHNNGYSKGMTAKLFFRRDPAGIIPNDMESEKAWTQIAEFGAAGDTGYFSSVDVRIPDFDPKIDLDKDFGYTRHFQFKAVAYFGADPIPNLDSSTYAGANIIDAIAISSASKSNINSLMPPSVTFSAPFDFANTNAVTISNIDGDFLSGLRIYVRIVSSYGSPLEQSGYFTLARTEPFATIERYQVSISLGNRPSPNADTDTSTNPPTPKPASYTIQYRYPWEDWDDSNINWSYRQIGPTITY